MPNGVHRAARLSSGGEEGYQHHHQQQQERYLPSWPPLVETAALPLPPIQLLRLVPSWYPDYKVTCVVKKSTTTVGPISHQHHPATGVSPAFRSTLRPSSSSIPPAEAAELTVAEWLYGILITWPDEIWNRLLLTQHYPRKEDGSHHQQHPLSCLKLSLGPYHTVEIVGSAPAQKLSDSRQQQPPPPPPTDPHHLHSPPIKENDDSVLWLQMALVEGGGGDDDHAVIWPPTLGIYELMARPRSDVQVVIVRRGVRWIAVTSPAAPTPSYHHHTVVLRQLDPRHQPDLLKASSSHKVNTTTTTTATATTQSTGPETDSASVSSPLKRKRRRRKRTTSEPVPPQPTVTQARFSKVPPRPTGTPKAARKGSAGDPRPAEPENKTAHRASSENTTGNPASAQAERGQVSAALPPQVHRPRQHSATNNVSQDDAEERGQVSVAALVHPHPERSAMNSVSKDNENGLDENGLGAKGNDQNHRTMPEVDKLRNKGQNGATPSSSPPPHHRPSSATADDKDDDDDMEEESQTDEEDLETQTPLVVPEAKKDSSMDYRPENDIDRGRSEENASESDDMDSDSDDEDEDDDDSDIEDLETPGTSTSKTEQLNSGKTSGGQAQLKTDATERNGAGDMPRQKKSQSNENRGSLKLALGEQKTLALTGDDRDAANPPVENDEGSFSASSSESSSSLGSNGDLAPIARPLSETEKVYNSPSNLLSSEKVKKASSDSSEDDDDSSSSSSTSSSASSTSSSSSSSSSTSDSDSDSNSDDTAFLEQGTSQSKAIESSSRSSGTGSSMEEGTGAINRQASDSDRPVTHRVPLLSDIDAMVKDGEKAAPPAQVADSEPDSDSSSSDDSTSSGISTSDSSKDANQPTATPHSTSQSMTTREGSARRPTLFPKGRKIVIDPSLPPL